MRRTTLVWGLLVAVLSTWACEDPPAGPTLEIDAAADVTGVLFLDRNGNGQLDAADSRVKAWPLRLIAPNGSVLASGASDTLGIFGFEDVPAGHVRLEISRAALGDTLEIFGLDLDRQLTLGRDDSVFVTTGFTYPKVALAAVDTVRLGRRVFTEGIALNTLFSNGPRELHLRAGAKALRTTNVVRTGVFVGDSVRVLGRRGVEAGQPVLVDVEIFPLRPSVEDPAPLALTTARAATAGGGVFGADLARIRTADLKTSTNVDNDVVLTADDGTGSVEILVRAFLGTDASFFNPDSVRIREATGLLIPILVDGQTKWRLAVRTATDLRVEREPAPQAPAAKAPVAVEETHSVVRAQQAVAAGCSRAFARARGRESRCWERSGVVATQRLDDFLGRMANFASPRK